MPKAPYRAMRDQPSARLRAACGPAGTRSRTPFLPTLLCQSLKLGCNLDGHGSDPEDGSTSATIGETTDDREDHSWHGGRSVTGLFVPGAAGRPLLCGLRETANPDAAHSVSGSGTWVSWPLSVPSQAHGHEAPQVRRPLPAMRRCRAARAEAWIVDTAEVSGAVAGYRGSPYAPERRFGAFRHLTTRARWGVRVGGSCARSLD